jgi:hypothetical protein
MESNYLTVPTNSKYGLKGTDCFPNFENLFFKKYSNLNTLIKINEAYANLKKNSQNYNLEDILNHISQFINTIIEYDPKGAREEYAKKNKRF